MYAPHWSGWAVRDPPPSPFPARAQPRVFCFSRARLSALQPLPGTRGFLFEPMTYLYPALQQQRVMRTTAREYGLPAPANLPPLSPDELRQLLNNHPAQPECSADAI